MNLNRQSITLSIDQLQSGPFCIVAPLCKLFPKSRTLRTTTSSQRHAKSEGLQTEGICARLQKLKSRKRKNIFIMITKPLQLHSCGTASTSSLMSIAEALKRESMQPPVRAGLAGSRLTVGTFDSLTSVCTSDVALDLRTVPLRSQESRISTPKRRRRKSAPGSKTRQRQRMLNDPEYLRAIARLSVQLRDLEDASSKLLGTPPVLTFRSLPMTQLSPLSSMSGFQIRLSPQQSVSPRVVPHLSDPGTGEGDKRIDIPKDRRDGDFQVRMLYLTNELIPTMQAGERLSPTTEGNSWAALLPPIDISTGYASSKALSTRNKDIRKSKTISSLFPITEEKTKVAVDFVAVADLPAEESKIEQLTEREIPDVVAQLRKLHTTKPVQTLAVEDALIPLNNLIIQQEIEQIRRQMLLSTPAMDVHDTPCPSSEDLLRRREFRRKRSLLQTAYISVKPDTDGHEKHHGTTSSVHESVFDTAAYAEGAADRRSRASSTVLSIMAPKAIKPDVAPLKVHKRLSQGSGSTVQSGRSFFTSSSVYSSQASFKHASRPLTPLSETVNDINQAILEGFEYNASHFRPEESIKSTVDDTASILSSTSSKRFGMLFESLSCEPLELQLLKVIDFDEKPVRPLLADYAFAREDFLRPNESISRKTRTLKS